MQDLEGKLRAAHAARKAVEDEGAELRYQEASRKRLLRTVGRKTTTSFVGALARFEQHFGAVWGHGLPDAEKTPDQLAWAAVWDQCRTEVLNNGNNQLRALESELAQHTVRWDRYRAVIPAAPGV